MYLTRQHCLVLGGSQEGREKDCWEDGTENKKCPGKEIKGCGFSTSKKPKLLLLLEFYTEAPIVLQILLSIQALVVNAKPYFNEPGYEIYAGLPEDESRAQEYTKRLYIFCHAEQCFLH